MALGETSSTNPINSANSANSVNSINNKTNNLKISLNMNETLLDEIKHEILSKIVTLLGASIVHHIRLSDLCIINKVESTQYFPPHVRNLNQDLIYDTLSNLKLPDLDNFKYKPKDAKYKKNRK